jgi:hypothetical protein
LIKESVDYGGIIKKILNEINSWQIKNNML